MSRRQKKQEKRYNPLEDPNVSLSGAELLQFLPHSSAGNIVTPASIAGIPDVWRALNLIANKMAVLDLLSYYNSSDGGNDPARDHFSYRVLKSPNEIMTPFIFKKTMALHSLIWGNGYAACPRNSLFEVEELWPLDPQATYPDMSTGRLLYQTTINNEPFTLQPYEVLHVLNGLSFDGIKGMPITFYLKDALGLSQAIQTYQSVYFQNNGMPSIVIELPPDMSQPEKVERFRKTWGDIHVGLQNSHRPALMTNGAKLAAQLNKDNVAGAVVELSEAQTRAIAKIFGIPASYFGLADSYTSHNSLESQSKQFLSDTLEPHLRCFEQACEKVLLRESEKQRESVFISFDRSKLIELDAKTVEDIDNQRLMNNQISWEEFRFKKSMTVNRSGTFFRPANINLVDENFEVVTPEPPEPPAVEATEQEQQEPDTKVVTDQKEEPKADQTAERLHKLTEMTVRRLISRVKKSVEYHAQKGDLRTCDLEAEHRGVWLENLTIFGQGVDAIMKFFNEIKSEVNAIAVQDIPLIRWDQYQVKVMNLIGG